MTSKLPRWLWIRFSVMAMMLSGAATGLAAIAPPSGASSHVGPAFAALSAGTLNALAVHRGEVVPNEAAPGYESNPGDQVILPNVQASNIGPGPENETPIAADPNNALKLATGANDYNCTSIQGFYVSSNGGVTWPVQHCMAVLPGKMGFGDPNVAYGNDGTLYVLGPQATGALTSSVIAVQKRVPMLGWQAVTPGPTAYYANGNTDKPWTEIDHTPTSPFFGCIYTSVTQFNSTFTTETITVDHSCSGGATWSGPKAVSAPAVSPVVRQFSDLAIGNDGTVYATWLRCVVVGTDCTTPPMAIEFSKSTDGGNTWTIPTVVVMPVLAPNGCVCAFYGNVPGTNERTSEIPVIDVNAADDLEMVVYTWINPPGQMELFGVSSINGGASWGVPVKIFPSTRHNQFLPWLSVRDSDGLIGVTYLLQSGGSYQPYVAWSASGGAAWAGNIPLSTVTSVFANDGFGGTFMGDYTGNIWAGTVLHASWVDTRTGTAADETGGVSGL